MPKFLAMTSRGLVDTLASELHELPVKNIKKQTAGAEFEGSWAACYQANLVLRTATRIVLPVLDFPAYKPGELYYNTQKHDFTRYITPSQTIAVEARTRGSVLSDQRFVAMKVKDAIADQFREKTKARPDVDTVNPALKVHVRIVKNHVSLAVDTSGATLSQRGYRKKSVGAPLREHLAAGLLKMTGWEGKVPLVDPMCGTGSFLIEGALMAQNVPPGSLRRAFGFQNFQNYSAAQWQTVLNQAFSEEKESTPPLYGMDRSKKALQAAQTNAEAAGVKEAIYWRRLSVDELEPPGDKGVLVVNPPYGERMGAPEEVKDTYRDLAFVLKSRFQGWTCWLLSGNEELTRLLNMKSSRKIPVFNGPIECRFLKYAIR